MCGSTQRLSQSWTTRGKQKAGNVEKFIAEWEQTRQNKQTYPICTLPECTKTKSGQSKGEVNEEVNWQHREETQQKEMLLKPIQRNCHSYFISL